MWVVSGLKIELRDEFIRPETAAALDEYQHWAHRGAKARARHFGNLYQRLHREDVERAIAKLKQT
jgi:hypothetical protein